MKDEEGIRSLLFELSAKREEHFQVLDDLINKSEGRIDKTNQMIQALIDVIAETKHSSEKRISELNAMIEKTLADKTACINRYEKKLDKAEARADTLQRQNDQLIAQMNWLDGQIAKLEDFIYGTKSAPIPMTMPKTEVNVNGVPPASGGVLS